MIVIKTFKNADRAKAWASIHGYKDVNAIYSELVKGNEPMRNNIKFRIEGVKYDGH